MSRGPTISRRADACSRLATEHGDSLDGMVAAEPQPYLAIEETRPWGPDGAGGSERLPPALRDACERLGIRPLLIRRPGRYEVERRRVLVAYADHHDGWIGRTSVGDPAELLDLDLEALAAGRSPAGIERSGEPVVLACTHGTVDACCAELGRPVASALHERFGDALWQCSHVGGCRFAANALLLPRGIVLGRLAPGTAPEVVGAALAGRLALDHYRGRPGAPQAVQVAEAYLRRRLGVEALDAVEVLEHAAGDANRPGTARLRADGRDYELRLRLESLPPRPGGCGDDELVELEEYRVVYCQPVEGLGAAA